MMKKTTPLLLATLAFIAIGCNQKTSKNTSTSSSDQYNYSTGGVQSGSTTGTTTSGSTTTGSTTGNPQTGGTGYPPNSYTNEVNMPAISCPVPSSNGSLTCTDFDSVYSTIPTYPIVIAGGRTWGPGLNPSGNVSVGSFPSIDEMVAATKTDTKLRVRFRVLPQPKATKDREYCYGRHSKDTMGSNLSADYCVYTKLRFAVIAVEKEVWQRHLNGESIYLGSPRIVSVDGSQGVSTGKCSVWYDLPHVAGKDYVIVVKDINSDNECRYRTGLGTPEYNGSCPNNAPVRTASCASMEMQVQTDYTSY